MFAFREEVLKFVFVTLFHSVSSIAYLLFAYAGSTREKSVEL